jgi:hypothetical protein
MKQNGGALLEVDGGLIDWPRGRLYFGDVP